MRALYGMFIKEPSIAKRNLVAYFALSSSQQKPLKDFILK